MRRRWSQLYQPRGNQFLQILFDGHTHVDKQECVHLTLFRKTRKTWLFTGHLYVVKDSTYAVKKCTMNLSKKTGVNLWKTSTSCSSLSNFLTAIGF